MHAVKCVRTHDKDVSKNIKKIIDGHWGRHLFEWALGVVWNQHDNKLYLKRIKTVLLTNNPYIIQFTNLNDIIWKSKKFSVKWWGGSRDADLKCLHKQVTKTKISNSEKATNKKK